MGAIVAIFLIRNNFSLSILIVMSRGDRRRWTRLYPRRFQHRLPSRASAVRELLKRGLAVDAIDLETAGRQSSSFGIVNDDRHEAEGTQRNRVPSAPMDRRRQR
jgi:hypothetical protein